MWGRLGFNPDLSNDKFKAILANRFSDTNADELFEAWQNASLIYPLVTGFHWGSLDFQWYIESGQSRPFYVQTPTGYNDLDNFISMPVHPGTDNVSIPKYVQAKMEGKTLEGTSPFDAARQIEEKANKALSWTAKHTSKGGELGTTIRDIQSIAYMGKHFAHKIKAATYLAIFRETYDKNDEEKMLAELKQAALYWRYYVSNSLIQNNNPLWTNRVGHVDWKNYYRHVYLEIRSKGGQLDIPSMQESKGGTILEAEDSEYTVAEIESNNKGYTGEGYLTSKHGHAPVSVKWKYNAPEAGKYLLEFRYSLKRQKHFKTHLKINDQPISGLTFWESATPKSWVWDGIIVDLKKGNNEIKISPEGLINFDHLNVLRLK
jgi:hypothetical protein